jgi:hypothetical protein
LARNFRYFEKKRGHRRTGSRIVGSAGEAIFFAVLLVVGCAGTVAGISWLVIPEWRVNHGFVQQTCVLLQKRLVRQDGESGPIYRPEFRIEYHVHGTTYRPPGAYDLHRTPFNREDAQAVLDRFTEGRKYPCWYDPGNPDAVVLVRGYQWWIWLVLLIPVSFVALGAGGSVYTILHWGRSTERRAAMARRIAAQDPFDAAAVDPKFPNIPDCREIGSSPGTRLAYRLPLSRSPGWALFGLLAACVAWNGAVSYFLVTAIRNHLEGHPDWFLTFFNLPFLAIGVVLVSWLVRQFVTVMGIGPTLVEISDHPLLPGRQYRLFLSQAGSLTLKSFDVFLVCEEEAIYRQGTNTRTETREVYRQPVLAREGFEIRQGEPFEAECTLDVPAAAMHSFKANHNAVYWKIVLQGNATVWRPFQRAFPVIVHPGPAHAEPLEAKP